MSGTCTQDQQSECGNRCLPWCGLACLGRWPGPEGYYVRRQYYTQLAKVKTEQEAQYVEDRWQVADNVLLSIGLRNEQFTNYTGSNEAYIRQRHQLAPRLGAAWDVHGDSSLKLFGNAGATTWPCRTTWRCARLPRRSTRRSTSPTPAWIPSRARPPA